jgi:hypothetical protein
LIVKGCVGTARSALAAKFHRLTPEQLVMASAPPSKLTLLGLVRHLTEMERRSSVWAFGPPVQLHLVYGDYVAGGPNWALDERGSSRLEPVLNRRRREIGGAQPCVECVDERSAVAA